MPAKLDGAEVAPNTDSSDNAASGGSDPSAAVGPDSGGSDAIAPPPPPPPPPAPRPEPRSTSRKERLMAEALSPEHFLNHTPKNPYCDACNQARCYHQRVRHKPMEGHYLQDESRTSHFQKVRVYIITISKSGSGPSATGLGQSGESQVLAIDDAVSGAIVAVSYWNTVRFIQAQVNDIAPHRT